MRFKPQMCGLEEELASLQPDVERRARVVAMRVRNGLGGMRCRTMAAVVTVAAMANMPRPRMRRMIRRLAIMRALGHGGA